MIKVSLLDKTSKDLFEKKKKKLTAKDSGVFFFVFNCKEKLPSRRGPPIYPVGNYGMAGK